MDITKIRNLLAVLSIAVILLACGCVQKGADVSKNNVTQLPSQCILLNKSAELSNYVGEYAEASQGKTFLIINMKLENHGYQTFSVNPNYFAVVIDNVAYPYDSSTFSTKSPLTSATLLDGGKTAGYLVYQVPKGTTTYNLRYVGSGDYLFIYGNLPETSTAPQAPPKLPQRTITFDLGEGIQTLLPDYVTSQPGAIFQTTLQDITIQPGATIQKTHINGISGGYADVIIETLQGSVDKDQLMKDALKVEKINGFNTNEKGSYDAILASGDKITVYQRENAIATGSGGAFDICAFMPDKSMFITITSTLAQNRWDALLKTLKIGEMMPPTA